MHYPAYMNCALLIMKYMLCWISEHWLLSRAFVLLLFVQWPLFSDSLNSMFSDPCWVYSKKLTVLHVNCSIWPRASQPHDPTAGVAKSAYCKRLWRFFLFLFFLFFLACFLSVVAYLGLMPSRYFLYVI